MGRIRRRHATPLLVLALNGCGDPTRLHTKTTSPEPPAPSREGGSSIDASRDAAGHTDAAMDADAGEGSAPACEGEGGRLLWTRVFDFDLGTEAPVIGPLASSPVGLQRCGDGVCLLGSLDGRLRIDQVLVAQGGVDAYLVKLTFDGTLAWVRRIGGTSMSDRFAPASLSSDGEGNLVVAGACIGRAHFRDAGGQDVAVDCASTYPAELVLAHLDPSGSLDWHTSLGNVHEDNPAHVETDAHGRTVVVGYRRSAPDDEGFVIGFERDGTRSFQRTFSGGFAAFHRAAFDPEGNIVVAGYFGRGAALQASADGGEIALPADGPSVCVVKTTRDGEHLWSRCFEAERQPSLQLSVVPDGSIVLAGTFTGALDFGAAPPDGAASPRALMSTNRDIYLAKLTPDGQLVWQRRLGGDGGDSADLGLATTPGGSLVLPGRTTGTLGFDDGSTVASSERAALFVAEFDEDGDALWSRQLGDRASLAANDSFALGDCSTFYTAVEYRGDLYTPNVSTTDRTAGVVVIAGTY